jgi:hypothetical protein
MDGVETAIGATLAVTIGLIWLASKALDRHIKRRTRRRFQTTARQAARTKADVLRGIAAAKTARDQIQATADLETCLAIWHSTPHDIPNPRSKEDPQ